MTKMQENPKRTNAVPSSVHPECNNCKILTWGFLFRGYCLLLGSATW